MSMAPEFWAVGLDVTHNYDIKRQDQPWIRRIIDVFIYNKNEYTYCCELMPSHWLEYLETFVDFFENVPEETKERIVQEYCYEPTDDCYVHVNDVNEIKEFHTKLPGEAETLAEAKEYWAGNSPF